MPTITENDAIKAFQAAKAFPDDVEVQRKTGAIRDAYKRQQETAGLPMFAGLEASTREQQAATRRLYQDRVNHGLEPDALERLNAQLRDRPEEKFEVFNERFFAESFGLPKDQARTMRKDLISSYSSKTWGEEITDDKAFADRLGAEFDLEDSVDDQAQKSAMRGLPSVIGWLDPKAGGQEPKQAAANQARLQKRYQETADATNARLSPYRQIVAQTVEDLRATMGVDGATGEAGSFRDFAARLTEIPKEDRNFVIGAIIENAGGGETKDGISGAAQKVAENFSRGARDLAQDVPAFLDRTQLGTLSMLVNQGAEIEGDASTVAGYLAGVNARLGAAADPSGTAGLQKLLEGKGPMTKPSPEIVAAAKAEVEKAFDVLDLQADLRQIADENIDPAKGEYMVTRGLYGAARSIPYTLVAMAPGGIAINTAALSEQSYQTMRRANPDMSRGEAMAISAVAGPIMAGLEKIPAAILTGKLPTLGRFLNKAVATTGSAASRFAIRTAEGTAVEMLQENVQDFTPFAVQGTVAALSDDVPSVPWEKVYGGKFWETQGELFFATLPLALIGGGVGTVRDFSAARSLMHDPRAVASIIGNEAKASEIAEAAQAGQYDRAQTLLREGMAAVKADTSDLSAVRSKAAMELRADAAAKAETITKAETAGILPAIGRTAEGWSLRFQDGSARAFESHAEADAARWQHSEEQGLSIAESTRSVIRSVESQIEAGREVAFSFVDERRTLLDATKDGEVSKDAALNRAGIAEDIGGQAVTQQPMDEGTDPGAEYEEAFTASELAAIAEDDKLALFQILGSNKTEFADGVQRTTIRLFQGATPLTVIEEKLEGDASAMLANGRRGWMLTGLRRYERMSGDKILPRTDGEVTDGHLKEAWSHLGQSYFVGRSRKGDVGDVWKSRDFRKSAAKLLRTPLGAAFDGYARFFKSVWKRAAKLNKLRREGKLDADLERELARSVGFGEQAQYEQSVEAEAARLKQEMEDAGFEAEVGLSSEQITEIANDIGGMTHLSPVIERSIRLYSQSSPGARDELEVSLRGAFDRLDGGEGDYPGDGPFYQFVDDMEAWILGELKAVGIAPSFTPTDDAPFSVISVSRGKPSGKIEFPNNGISGPSGSRLTGYEWQFKFEEVPDQEGELVLRRFSDWDKAEQSADTGRSIVHQFQVEKPDGTASTVSLESAIKELGFTANETGAKPVKDLASTVKSLAKLQLKLSVLENKADERAQWLKEYQREFDRVKEGPKPKWEAVIKEGDFPGVPKVVYSMGGIEVKERYGKDEAALVESGQWERDARRFSEDRNEHARIVATEKAGADPVGDSVGSDVIATKKAIRKAEQKIAAVTESAQSDTSFSVITNADSRISEMFSPYLRNPEQRLRIVREAQLRSVEKAREWQTIIRANRPNVDIEAERKTREQDILADKLDTLSAGEIASLGNDALLEDNSLRPILSEMTRIGSYKTKTGKTVRFWRGGLMSKSEAKRRGMDTKGGEWDDIPEGLPAYVWGGSTTPEQAATRFGFGSVSEFWDAISSEVQSYRDRKDEIAAANARIREIEKEARAESHAWAAEQRKLRQTVGTDRATLIGAMRTLDAMISALPSEIRGKVGGFVRLAQFKTPGAMLAELERRAGKLDTELERWLKKEADKGVKKLFEIAKPAKDQSGKKRVGKAGADIHDLFDTARQAWKNWTADKAEAHALALEATVAKGEMTPEAEAHALLEAEMVRSFGGWNEADSTRRIHALETANEIWTAGYHEYKAKKATEKERRDGIRADLRADTGKQGKKSERVLAEMAGVALPGKAKDFFLSLLNFEQLTAWAFGSESKWARWFADEQRKAENAKLDAVQSVTEGVEDLFTRLAGGNRFKGEALQYRMMQRSLEATAANGDVVPLSELEAISALLMWQQEDGKRHLRGKHDEDGNLVSEWSYDEDFIDEISGKLSPEAWEILGHLQAEYGKEYEPLNAVYRDIYGINLPKNPNYSPLLVKPQQASGGQTVDPVTGSTMSGGGFTPGSLRTRAQISAEPDFRDAVATFIAHKKQIEHWKAHARFILDANAVLGNREVGNSVEAAHGQEAVKILRKWLDAIAQGGVRDAGAGTGLMRFFEKITGRAASMALVGRVGTLAVQSTQLAAASALMPTGAYVVRLGKLLSGNLGWKAAMGSAYIQRRLAQQPVMVQAAMEGLKAGRPNQLKHQVRKIGQLINGADALFTAGTYAMVHDYHFREAIKGGMTDAEADAYAHQTAERVVDSVAQPSRMGARSFLEVSSSNPFMRLAWAFASDARKNAALLGFSAVKGTEAEFARSALFVVLLNGLISGVIRNAWRDMRDDGDDEVFDEKYWSAKRLALSTGSDWLFGFPVIGEEIQRAIYSAAGEYTPDSGLLSAVPQAPGAAKNLLEGDSTDTLRDVEKILTAAGLFSDSTAAGVSVMHLIRDLYGLTENFTPDN